MAQAPRRRTLDLAGASLALLVSVLWGANPVAIKIGLADAPPIRLACLRFLVGGGVILAWAWSTGRLRGFALARHETGPLITLSLIFAAQIVSMNVGTGLTSAAHAAVALNLYAVHTVVLAHFLVPGDRLTWRRLVGVLIAYGGVVMLVAPDPGIGGDGTTRASGGGTLVGDVVMLGSGFLLGARTVYLARIVQRFEPVKLLLAQATIGTGLFALFSTILEGDPTRWTPSLGASIAYQGVVIAGFNFVVNLWLLRRYLPSALASLFLTQPIFGVLAAAAVTGDPLTPELLGASVAVAIGIGLTTR
jgi:drug/metabolite transporter (DMT)-like permease